MQDDNGWIKYENLVLSEIRRLSETLEKIDAKIDKMSDDILILNMKAGLFGGLAGVIFGAITSYVISR